MRRLALLVLLVLLACANRPVRPMASGCTDESKWLDPTPPRNLFGNTWFVGACGLTSLLITSNEGHVLIDGLTAEGASVVEANIRALGFRTEEVKLILSSHEHFDHVGGIAQLANDTGATVVARPAAVPALERGKGDRTDPQFLSADAFPPISRVRVLKDGEAVTLGSLSFTAHATPGHTPGSTSWTWTSCDPVRGCRKYAYADSLTSISDDVYRFSDDAVALTAFRGSLDTVEALPCDTLVTPHPSASQLWERLTESGLPADPRACEAYAKRARDGLQKRIDAEHTSKREH